MKLAVALLLLALFTSPHIALAQYGDAYHPPNNYLIQKELREYSQTQIDMARNSYNTPIRRAPSSGIREMLKNGPEVKVVELTPEQKEKQRLWEAKVKAEEAARNKRWAADAERYRAKMLVHQPYIDQFFNAGFNDVEAHAIVEEYMESSASTVEEKLAQRSDAFDLIPIMEGVKQNIASISYADFVDAMGFLLWKAPLTSLELIQKVEKRFKDQILELDNLKVIAIIIFCNSAIYHQQYQQVPDEFFALQKKYPEMAMQVVRMTPKDRNPYQARRWKMSCDHTSTKKSNGTKKDCQDLKVEYDGYRAIIDAEAEVARTKLYGENMGRLYGTTDAAEIIRLLAQVNNYKPSNAPYLTVLDVTTARDEQGVSLWDSANPLSVKYFSLDLIADATLSITASTSLLWELVLLGDQEALNLYAIIICREEDPTVKRKLDQNLLDLAQLSDVPLGMDALKLYFLTSWFFAKSRSDLPSSDTYMASQMDRVEQIVKAIHPSRLKFFSYMLVEPIYTDYSNPTLAQHHKAFGNRHYY